VTKGRHDLRVDIRAAPIGEARVACVLADAVLPDRGQMGGYRSKANAWRPTGDIAIGRRADLQGSRREQPESAGGRAFGVTRYRLISARTGPPVLAHVPHVGGESGTFRSRRA
jgi:hypothetical protein